MVLNTHLNPVQTPVTGSEPLAECTEPLEALAEFYCALNTRDMSLMETQGGASPEAEMDNPLGGIRRGWSEIRTGYEKLFASPGEYRFEFWTTRCTGMARSSGLSGASVGG